MAMLSGKQIRLEEGVDPLGQISSFLSLDEPWNCCHEIGKRKGLLSQGFEVHALKFNILLTYYITVYLSDFNMHVNIPF